MSRRIMFLRGSDNHPVGCVAIESDRSSPNRLSYQVSVLNPSDKFDRALARQLAIGRLVEKPITIYSSYDVGNMHDVSQEVMIDIANNHTLPKRAVKAARDWCSKHILP